MLLGGILLAGLLAALALGLRPSDLVPDSSGALSVARNFFSASLAPALRYEDPNAPATAVPIVAKAASAALTTARYAAAGTSLSLVFGAILGFFGSRAAYGRTARTPVGAFLFGSARIVIALARSVHELIWAVILLAAFGTTPAAAVIAIAIPYSGTFAKVFSEMIDESPRSAADALQATGATRTIAFLFARLPGAVPDLVAYTLYRFECGLRSAAIMGFIGIPTLGYYIARSFENLHYQEVWTYLYALMILVIGFDLWSGAIRRRLVSPPPGPPRFLRASLALIAAGTATAWVMGGFGFTEFLSARRMDNVMRFAREALPYPIQQGEGIASALSWAWDLLASRGFEAAFVTLCVSVAAIVLAGIAASLLSPLAARNLAAARPFSAMPSRSWIWDPAVALTRSAFIIARAIPEYIWGFLLLAILGPQAWPLVLALAIHNLGILGRLGSETIEDLPPTTPATLRATGLSRAQLFATAIFPTVLPRFLVFFFYRWETCLRDATVLGMLGFGTLGFAITDARARLHYDEMLFFVSLGIALVLIGDLASLLVRRALHGTPSQP
ncbi:hypothetical protein BH23VER1_BH23VER1_01380 [soil metagenome]